jgi:hypothetical protein
MNAFTSSLLFISLLISTGHSVSAVGAGAQGTRSSAPARASTTQQPADGGWPRVYVTPSGARLVIDESQIASWLDRKRTATYAAVSYTPADQSSAALGTISAEADTKISVKAALGAQHAGTAAAAPTVFVNQKPAELMSLNGVAAYKPVTGTHLEWVSNTDSDVFRLGTTGTVLYLVSGRWLSGGAVHGPYGGAGYAPRYNPRTGTYARSAAAWGPDGAGGFRGGGGFLGGGRDGRC